MFRKSIVLCLLVCSLLLVVACSNHENEKKPDEGQAIEQDSNNKETNPTEETVSEEETEIEDETEQTSVHEEIKEPLYELDEGSNLIPLEEGTNEKVVLLTIDDVPDDYALDMAKTLKKLDASAIFFANGHFLESEENKEMLREIHDMGFPIGNHTYNHFNLTDLSKEKQKEEIINLNNLIEQIIGEKPKFFRAPFGENTDYAKQLVEDEGMLLMNWTYGYDYFEPYMEAEKLTEAMISGEGPEVDVTYSLLKPGANLLMHDREWTAAALEDIVKGLREKGYEMADPMTLKLPE
ncbi:polysaccharide deacetylase family protein [Gracilibacillus kekensis]|uniref:Peptidoglycan/xylan/chitin deacetylase, PgdA/CDA1 family n=1 Tax=Gracilibacillus kekensis TaxID=1027249 RepID=A0A1M7MBW4_9BACI|nr:polysaccharide deacetylase family protein [Gracilibacillus kekensis]SHM88260.1 Peptidoglycan/xylan/chitin deacetylase, PgdA/CDA1 family [Gracilibacillus kekensis]